MSRFDHPQVSPAIGEGTPVDRQFPTPWERTRAHLILVVLLVLFMWKGGWGIVILGMLCALIAIPWTLVTEVVIPLTVGYRCPGCGSRSLVFASCIPFGARFFRCKACGIRCQRDEPNDPWLDASGAEFGRFYSAKPPSFPISWQLSAAARGLLPFAGVGLLLLAVSELRSFVGIVPGSAVSYALAFGVGILVAFACWYLFFRETQEPVLPSVPDSSDLWDQDLDL